MQTPHDTPPALRARLLLRAHAIGALGTLDRNDGTPFVSQVSFATDHAGAPLFLLSDLALHTQNLKADTRASLLVHDAIAHGPGDPLALARATVTGRLVRSDDPADRARYLARNLDAVRYAAFTDFAIYRLEPRYVHFVGGFGVIVTMPACDVMLGAEQAQDFARNEAGAVAHINEDHADAVQIFATHLAHAPVPDAGTYRMTGCDCDGCDIAGPRGDVWRVAFDRTAGTSAGWRIAFKRLGEAARAGDVS